TRIAFETEDTALARSIFKRDEVLDAVNRNATNIIGEVIKGGKVGLNEALFMLSIIRKLERIGDQSKNIAEEIIFYVEAKILKHSGAARDKK
ncbi:MAG: phosphate transport system regulatory protein PhoU, partial [Bacteroidetes bacterium]|nr:phosphate transport system regulatory protein PhoU [Bacteroidota bacterium]